MDNNNCLAGISLAAGFDLLHFFSHRSTRRRTVNIKWRAKFVSILLFAICLSNYSHANDVQSAPRAASQKPQLSQLVIVMDDLGNHLERGRRAIELPGAITYAILPHTPAAKKLAWYATRYDQRKEVIIHMPMQTRSGKRLGPGALRDQFDKDTFQQVLQRAVDAVPFARGLNNHMGSALTSMPDRMQWLMAALDKLDFYFIDSRTTHHSTAASKAVERQLPNLSRDVFLDNSLDESALDHAFEKALRIARQRGLAVLLAHPHDASLSYLERRLPTLAEEGIELVAASEAIERRKIFAIDAPTTQDNIALTPPPHHHQH